MLFLSKVTGISIQESQCFFVLLNLDFSCDLSERTMRINLVLIKLSEKFQNWHDPQVIPDID